MPGLSRALRPGQNLTATNDQKSPCGLKLLPAAPHAPELLRISSVGKVGRTGVLGLAGGKEHSFLCPAGDLGSPKQTGSVLSP